ncbi:MAG: class I SAM-dependent methyltransferase [Acidimicrobiales bacterium]|nr:class I SAM-dependent methyltransferase [Acidimicrobiales bacterium]
MSRPLPANLKDLYGVMTPESAAQMYGGGSLVIDGVEFVSGYAPDSTPDRFYIVKSAELIAMYREFLDAVRPARVFELGIAEGGSVALLALMSYVEQLVAIDNEPNRLPALDDFIGARGLEGSVSAHYGIDQADGATLAGLVERHFDHGEVDLVIDDASHVYDLSVASFEALFPRLAPGGWYLLEDWAQPLKFAAAVVRASTDDAGPPADAPDLPVPLSRLGLELTIATCTASGVVDRVMVNHEFIAARRGPEPVDPASFRLADLTAGPVPGFLAEGAGRA